MIDIRSIKYYLLKKIGSSVVIVYNGSRNKKEKYSGVIYKVYCNVFTIKLCNGEIKCFSFSDILTKCIKIYI